jgi:hypothetical protein
LFESKARKQAHSKLCNCFRNAAIGQNGTSENRKCGRAKYIYDILGIKPPKVVDGFKQDPIDGVSMAYSFTDAKMKMIVRGQADFCLLALPNTF